MKNNYKIGFLIFLLLITIKNNFACTFIIRNDTRTTTIIVDPYNRQALYLNPGQKAEIDPSISGWQGYFYHEKLNIYVPQDDNKNQFYCRYQLIENYCTSSKTNLTVNDIIQFIHKPNDRFDIVEFGAPERGVHKH